MIDPITTTVVGSWFATSVLYGVFSLRNQSRIRDLSESTHHIVNSQRSLMLRTIALLSRRIADENPSDKKAQKAAKEAEQDAIDSGSERR